MAIEANRTLAEALAEAKASAKDNVLKHSEISRKHLDLLIRAKWLTPVIRGWYLLSKPEAEGSSTAWYGGFWAFIQHYLIDRFGKQGYCLSAEASLDFIVDESNIPSQVTVITQKSSNQNVELPHETSLMLYSDTKNFPTDIVKKNGIYVMSLPLALSRLSPTYYKNNPLNVEIALKTLSSINDLSRVLLDGVKIADAGRLAGALEALGDSKGAEQIKKDFEATGTDIEITNPFENHVPLIPTRKRLTSPHVGRIEAMWELMRKEVLKIFPSEPGIAKDKEKPIRIIQELYKQDAYHSLSIEGYEVTEDLIQKIATGGWNPDEDPKDKEQRDALAARGYHEAFLAVLDSARKVLREENSGEVFEADLQGWYRALFTPSVNAKLIKPSDLAGYRSNQVYIKGARHVPPSKDAVPDAMETLFNKLKQEKSAAVRAVLGHFMFVYIHPYMDGNGRIGRFILNLMLISGGFHWTVIRSGERTRYMRALEEASSNCNIVPFAEFVASELKFWEAQNS